MIREWRAELLGGGVSVSVTAKAYRLLRAVLMTAVEEDKILLQNPCRIRGAGDEDAAERPVLTVEQVFALSERVGRRPVGNVRALPRRVPAAIPAGRRDAHLARAYCVNAPKPSTPCGRWLTTAGPIAGMTGGSSRSFC